MGYWLGGKTKVKENACSQLITQIPIAAFQLFPTSLSNLPLFYKLLLLDLLPDIFCCKKDHQNLKL